MLISGELEQAAEKICVTDSGATPNKPCIFPFKFNGVLYNECTWTSAHLTEHKPWCSTFVDETGERSILYHYMPPNVSRIPKYVDVKCSLLRMDLQVTTWEGRVSGATVDQAAPYHQTIAYHLLHLRPRVKVRVQRNL